jgi:integrase
VTAPASRETRLRDPKSEAADFASAFHAKQERTLSQTTFYVWEAVMQSSLCVIDAAGRRRSPATMPGFRSGRAPANKGARYPADPPPVEEIVAVMRQAGRSAHGVRLRGLISVLWRSGMRIAEALALNESDLNRERGSLLVRNGKGGKRREVGMDPWGWEQLAPLDLRERLPVGSLFCVITGPTRGRSWSSASVRTQLRHTARTAGVRRRFAPHQLRHAHAVEMAREGVPLTSFSASSATPT